MHNTFICTHCGEHHPAEERTVFDEALCMNCLSKHTATCTHCGTRIWISNNAGTEDMPLCQSCYDDHYVSCVECGALLGSVARMLKQEERSDKIGKKGTGERRWQK